MQTAECQPNGSLAFTRGNYLSTVTLPIKLSIPISTVFLSFSYAVDVLQVKHIIVCGHYGCGGVTAAIDNPQLGLINNWLLHIRDYYLKHREYLDQMPAEDRSDKLAEINVAEQVYNLANSTVLQNAWERGQAVEVHGFVYGIEDGRLEYLGVRCASRSAVEDNYHKALEKILNPNHRLLCR